MTSHTWKTGGPGNRQVLHSTSGRGSDAIGVGLGEDVLGPFASQKLAQQVAGALENAYLAGVEVTSAAIRHILYPETPS